MPPKNPTQNPLRIDWPHHLRAGLAPPHYYTRERKFQFMTQLYNNRIQFITTLDNLTQEEKLEEAVRQRTNLNSKRMKLNRRRKLTAREERSRRKAEAAAEAEAQQPPLPATPPGTRPPSPVSQIYTPIEHPPITPDEVVDGLADLQVRTQIQDDLESDLIFDANPVVGAIPGIPNTKDYEISDLTIQNNTQDTFSIWTAVAMALYQSHARWPTVKANIIKYFFRVMGDFNHPRHRVYHVLQKRSELYPGRPDLADFLLNNDNTTKAWSMDPGLWTVIADFYDTEVVIIRSREVFPQGTIFPEIYNDADPDRECHYFVVVRGRENAGRQVILYFSINEDGTEQAWPVRYPAQYKGHERDPAGVGLDMSNRIDDMPWASKYHDDPARQGLQALSRIAVPENDPLYRADATEELQLAALGKDLSYIALQALEQWGNIKRSEGHMDTWSGEIRQQ